MGRWLRLIGTALSILLLAWLVTRHDWRRVLESLSQIRIRVIAIVAGLFLLRYVFQTLRWMFLLRAQRVELHFLAAFRLVLTGLFASNFLPSTVGGDVIRLIGVMPTATSAVVSGASLVADRAIGVISMLPFLPISMTVLGDAQIREMTGMSMSAVLPPGVRRRFSASLRTLQEALRLWASKPGWLVLAFLLSIMGALVYMLGIWILARGIGIEVSLLEVAGISAATYFITLIPISINGYGVREISVVALYAQLHVPIVAATALALVSRIIMLCVSLPGAIWLPGTIAKSSGKPFR
jgi:uncharacterized membrane protein YbhN (UPF0104 family)